MKMPAKMVYFTCLYQMAANAYTCDM